VSYDSLCLPDGVAGEESAARVWSVDMVWLMKLPIKPVVLLLATAAAALAVPEYAVVVSEKTWADPAWKRVADALVARHAGAAVIRWQTSVVETTAPLRAAIPRHVCFVATPAEATAAMVGDVHRLTRRLDDDPYTDVFWGILTGFDAENALAIAMESKPLTIRKVASGTELALDRVDEGVCYDELKQGHSVRKLSGQAPAVEVAPPDTTQALVNALNKGEPDLFVTSGHATERDWQIGFRYPNGYFKSKAGAMHGEDTAGQIFPVLSHNPKVYLPIGNCLMGHIDGPDAMALAWMKSAGVRQMLGYIKPTWYGYMGWGVLDYFVEQPGRYTMTEAFFANQAALVHRLETMFPEVAREEVIGDMGECAKPVHPSAAAAGAGVSKADGHGLLFDRDVVAFYGDPAWEARLAPGPLNWKQSLTASGPDEWTLTITPLAGADSFKTINNNGSQRGGRPIVQFFPERFVSSRLQIISGSEFNPVLTDTFILVPHPGPAAAAPWQITFKAEKPQ
jgi:zinc protease